MFSTYQGTSQNNFSNRSNVNKICQIPQNKHQNITNEKGEYLKFYNKITEFDYQIHF